MIGGVIVGAVALAGAVVAGLGWGAKKLYDNHKEQKRLAPTKCPSCRKKEALQTFKKEEVERTPITKSIQNKQTQRAETIEMIEITTRVYEKCKFCGEITFWDNTTTNM